ncbi:MAG: hypothetical protein ABIR47_09570 [Candidatus Kapaibacterium sp.]
MALFGYYEFGGTINSIMRLPAPPFQQLLLNIVNHDTSRHID